METLAGILATLAMIMLVVMVSSVVILRVLYNRIRRSRALAGAMLRTRARLSWGPQHEILKLRLRLQETLESGQAAVDLALSSDGPRGELPRLFRRVRKEGATLESQLRLLASESDSMLLAQGIPVARRRVDQLGGVVRHLRSAVAAGLGDLTDDTLTTLRSEVDREVAALNAGVQELRALNGNDGVSFPRRQLSMDRLNLNRGNAS